MASNLVLTPGGYRHAALVHRVEPYHAVNISEGKVRLKNLKTHALVDVPEHRIQPGEVPGFGSGWIAYAYWLNTTGKPVTGFQTTWNVPPAPATDNGQTIFLFNGIMLAGWQGTYANNSKGLIAGCCTRWSES